jgi:hypothetical protein
LEKDFNQLQQPQSQHDQLDFQEPLLKKSTEKKNKAPLEKSTKKKNKAPLKKRTKKTDQEIQAEKIQAALKKIKDRPKRIQDLATELNNYVGNSLAPGPIKWSTPLGMYPEVLVDFIEYEALLQLFVQGWLDITIIHWFEM